MLVRLIHLLDFRLLEHLDANLALENHSLSELAADNDLLLEHGPNFDLRKYGKLDIVESLKLISQLLASIRLAYQERYGENAIPGLNGDLDYVRFLDDLLFLANLESIILQLQASLLYQLFFVHGRDLLIEDINRIYEEQKRRGRKCKDWFFVYPSGKRPLSTTWPWNIRPSLVVLWGVCWMFYSHYGFVNLVTDSEGRYIDRADGQVVFDPAEHGIEGIPIYPSPPTCKSIVSSLF